VSRDTWKPGDGVEAALEMLDGPSEVAVDVVPSMDAQQPVATYRVWRKEDTKVVSCRIANDLYLRDERFESREEAHRAISVRYGRILEQNFVPGRAFFRVMRSKA
jgi:hypothetical protein